MTSSAIFDSLWGRPYEATLESLSRHFAIILGFRAFWGGCIHLTDLDSTPNMTGRRFHRTVDMIPATYLAAFDQQLPSGDLLI